METDILIKELNIAIIQLRAMRKATTDKFFIEYCKGKRDGYLNCINLIKYGRY